MRQQVQIKQAEPRDYDTLGELMFDAVRHGPSPYTEAQRKAWVAAPRKGEDWAERLDRQTIFIAWDGDDLLGFMSVELPGYIDFAFIRPNGRGRGLFRQLFIVVEAHARQNGADRLWTHASLMAQGPFEAMGFRVIKHETVTANGEVLKRAEMEKRLFPS